MSRTRLFAAAATLLIAPLTPSCESASPGVTDAGSPPAGPTPPSAAAPAPPPPTPTAPGDPTSTPSPAPAGPSDPGFPLPTAPGQSIPEFAWLQVTVNSSGESLDPDGYLATVVGRGAAPVPTVGSRYFSVPKGDLIVRLGGLAGNCRVDGADEQRVAVTDPYPAQPEAVFQVTCDADPFAAPGGRIALDVSSAVWTHQYDVTLDGKRTLRISGSGTYEFTGVADGNHVLAIPTFIFGGPLACDLERQDAGPVTVHDGGTTRVALRYECY